MSAPRRVKLFRNGRNQAVRIPREFELSGDEAILRREGERLIIEPVYGALPQASNGWDSRSAATTCSFTAQTVALGPSRN